MSFEDVDEAAVLVAGDFGLESDFLGVVSESPEGLELELPLESVA